jgi:uncharacterized protein DUF4115
MWLVLVAAAVVAVVAGVSLLARRPGRDEMHSVRSYHSELGTFERLPSRAVRTDRGPRPPLDDDGFGGRPHSSDEMIHDEAANRVRPLASGTGATARPVVRPGRLHFDDAPAVDMPHPGTGAPVTVRRQRRVQKNALASMNHRPRLGSSLLVVLVLVALVGALVFLGVRHSGKRSSTHPPARATSSTATHPRTATHSTSSTAAHGSGQGNGKRQQGKRHASHAPAAKPSQLVATAATATTATYTVGSPSFTVTVSASQECWVQASSEPAGTVLFQGLVAAGGSETVAATNETVVVLGAAGASLKVDGVPVVIPPASATPFTATFQPTTT